MSDLNLWHAIELLGAFSMGAAIIGLPVIVYAILYQVDAWIFVNDTKDDA